MALHRLNHIKCFCVHTRSLLSFIWDHGPPLAQDPDAISQQAGVYAELAVEVHDHLGQETKETIWGCESSSYKPKSGFFSVLLKTTLTHKAAR